MKKPRLRLALEELENRLAPAAAFTWTGAGGNTSWQNPLNWDVSTAPTAGAAVDITFNTAGTYTTNDDIAGLVINNLTISNNANLTISSSPGISFTLTNTLLVNTNATASISAPIQMGLPQVANELISVQSGSALTLTGALSGTSASQLSKQGAGPLTLTADNSNFTGPFKIDKSGGAGKVVITNAKGLGADTTSDLQSLDLASVAANSTKFTLTYPTAGNPTTTEITYTGNAAVDTAAIAAALNTLFNNLGFAGSPVAVTQVAGTGGPTATFSLNFTGTMAGFDFAQLTVTKTAGPGTITPGTYTDGGNPNVTTITTSTQLEVSIAAGATITNPLIINGAGLGGSPGALLNSAGNNTWQGDILMLASDGVNQTTYGVQGATQLTITGQISNTSTSGYQVIKEGTGTLYLDPRKDFSGNTFHANTVANDGVLAVGHPFALGAGGDTTTVNQTFLETAAFNINYTGNPFIASQYLNYAQVQTLTLSGATPGSTSFTLEFNGVSTAPIPFTNTPSDAGNIQAALTVPAMTTITGIGASVTVTGSNGVFDITFGGSLGGMQIPTLNPAIASGPGSAGITVGSSVSPIGFHTPNVNLVLASSGRGSGSIFNQAGHNIWDKLILGTNAIAGAINTNVGTALNTNVTFAGGITVTSLSMVKIGQGRLILPTANTIPAISINQGAINARDSNALGGISVLVNNPASLELQADGIPDSSGLAGLYNLYFPRTVSIGLVGNGWNGEGALNNMAGVNRIEGAVNVFGASIGVAPDPDPYNIQHVTANNLSQLTIDGSIGGTTLTKVGFGELVLTGSNTYLANFGQNSYDTFINQGWITVQNNQALGGKYANTDPVDQPGVRVASGAALMIKQDPAGNNLTLAYNMSLAGAGIKHRFAWLNQLGALENLDGINTATGQIYFNGAAAIGVEYDGLNVPVHASQLTLTGNLYDLPATTGHLDKVGTRRLVIQGPGLYSGGVDIKGGVLKIQNDTALGTGTPAANVTTNVMAGTALEFGPTLPSASGGSQRGLQVWYNRLVLSGTGNTTFGDAPLMIESDDNLWRGPIVLNSTVGVTFKNQLANRSLPTMTADNTGLVGGAVSIVTTTPGGAGLNAVQTLTFNGVTGGAFQLTLDDGAGNVATTNGIVFSTNLPVLIANIQAALDALAPTFGGTVNAGIVTVATSTPIIDILPNARFIATGAIGDSGNPADITVAGGGELVLIGGNTYRGTTFLKQGILTIGNATALGAGAIAELQTLTVAAVGNTFKLSFNGSVQTPLLTYTGTNADVTAIATALNALPEISGVGGIATVTRTGNVFNITLGGALAGFNQPAIVSDSPNAVVATLTDGEGGTVVSQGAQIQLQGGINVTGEPLILQGQGNPLGAEVQRLNLVGPPDSTFRLQFTNPTTSTTSSTGDLPFGATASAVQIALNQLASIQEGAGTGGGLVQVTETGDAVYTVIFRGTFGPGDEPQIVSSSSQQRLVVSGTIGTYTMNFTANATLTVALSPTAPANGGTNPSDSVENALNDLLSKPGTPGYVSATVHGTASVVTGVTGGYLITFGGTLAGQTPPLLIANPSSGASDDVAATVTLVGASSFTYESIKGGTTTAAPTQWFSNGPTFVSNGQTTFSNTNPKVNLAGPVTSVVSDPQDLNNLYIATAGGGAWKTTNDGTTWTPLFDTISTVQTFDVKGSSVADDTYSLTFTDPVTGGTTTTAPLPYNANAEQVKAALDGVVGAGNSVSVKQVINANGVNEQEQLIFDTAASSLVTGNTPSTWNPDVTGVTDGTRFRLVFGSGFGSRTNWITYTGVTATDAANIQAELNNLSTIKTPSGTGFVTCVVSSQDIINIIFGGALGASKQPLIKFEIGRQGGFGGGGGVFWNQPPDNLPIPDPFPTMNGVPAVHTGPGFQDGGKPNRDNGSITEIVPGEGPSTTNTVTFSGGSLAGVVVGSLGVTTTGAATVSMGVRSIPLTAGGSGYTAIPNVTISGGGGSGAQAIATISGGVRLGPAGFSRTFWGFGYDTANPPTVTFVGGGGGAGAAGTAVVGSGVVLVAVGGGGGGYAVPPAVSFVGGGGGGAQATAYISGGVVIGIVVTNPGAGYTSAPTVNLTPSPTGNNATANATISNIITGVNITASGAGYTSPPGIYFGTPGQVGLGAYGVAVLDATVTGLIISQSGTGYTSTPTVTITDPGGLGAGATAGAPTLGVAVTQKAIGANVDMAGGIVAMHPVNANIVYFGTGNANNWTDSYYGTGVYKTTDRGQTWNLLTDPRLANPNPLFGLAISSITFDPVDNNIIYVATSDRAANGIAGVGTVNAPTAHNPGVWRFNGNDNSWFNLTNQASAARRFNLSAQQQPPNGPHAFPNVPNTPGPDDNYILSFPQTGVTWSDVKISTNAAQNPGVGKYNGPNAVGPILYASLGNSNGSPNGFGGGPPPNFPNPSDNNAVYWMANPSRVSDSVLPQWYIAEPLPVPTTTVDSRPVNEFPTSTFPAYVGFNGRIQTALVPGGGAALPSATTNFLANDLIYAAVTVDTQTVPNGNFSYIEVSRNSGETWTRFNPAPPNFMAGEGNYASAILANTTDLFVAGATTNGTGDTFIYRFNVAAGTWTDISLSQDGSLIGPHTDVHTMAFSGVGATLQLLVGTDGGVWQYNLVGTGVWKNINGNLANQQFVGLATNPTDPTYAVGSGRGFSTAVYTGNQSWTQTQGLASSSLNGGVTAYDPNNSQIVWKIQDVPFFNPVINQTFRSLDGGQTWAQFGPAFPSALVVDARSRVFVQGITLTVFNPQNPGPGFVTIGNGGRVIGVANLQGPFIADPSFPNISDLGPTNPDPNTVYYANGLTVTVTKNFGVTWINRPIPAGGGAITDLVVDPSNRDTVYASIGGTVNGAGVGTVWKTIDAGRTWTQLGTGLLTGNPAWKLAYDTRTGDLYVGTDIGVFKLTAGTTTWARFGSHLPNVAVHALDLNTSTNILTAGTYGRSAYQFFLDTPTVNTGALRANAGNDIWSGPVILSGDTTISAPGNQTLRNGLAPTRLTILGPISDLTPGATSTLTKIGKGDVVFGGTNIYGGDTLVKEGNLVVQNPSALGSPLHGTTIETGAVLQLNNSSLNAEPLFLYGNGVEIDGHFTGALENVNSSNTYNGIATLETDSTIGVDQGSTLTILGPGSITDPGAPVHSLTKEGKGTLVFTSANTYGGNTFVNQGILNIQHNAALGAPNTTTTVLDGAQLALQAPTGASLSVTTEKLILSGTGDSGKGALYNVSGNNTFGSATNGITMTSIQGFSPQTSPAGVVAFGVASANDTLTIAGPIGEIDTEAQGSPSSPTMVMASGLTKVGAGTLALASANTYTGTTYVQAGILALRNSNALGNNLGRAIQRVTIADPGANDTFTLRFGTDITGPLNFGASANTVQNALNGLTSIGSGGVHVGMNTIYSGIDEVQTLTFTGVTPPTLNVPVAGAGGAFVAGTYYYVITAIGAAGETMPSNEQTVDVLDGNKVALSWNTVAGATGYRIYRTAIAGTYSGSSRVVTIPTGLATSYVDDGSLTTAGSPPAQTQFRLSFNGNATGPLTYTGNAANDAATIDAALNTPAILGPGGTVTVVPDASGTSFTITFGGTLQKSPRPLIIPTILSGAGNAVVTETIAGSGSASVVYTVAFNSALPGPQPLIIATGNNQTITTSVSTVADGGIGTLVSAGATLGLDGDPAHTNASISAGITPPATQQALYLNGNGVGGQGALRNMSGNNTWAGTINLESDSSIGADFTTTMTITGSIKDQFPAPVAPASLLPTDLTKVGTGTVVLPNANTFTGNVYVNAGALNIRNAKSLGVNTSSVQTVTVSGTDGTFTLFFDGYSASINSGPLAYNVDATTLQTAINNMLATAGSPGYVSAASHGSVTVVAEASGNVFDVTFGGTLASLHVPLLVAPSSSFVLSAKAFTAPILAGGGSLVEVKPGASLQMQTGGSLSENSLKPLVLEGQGYLNGGALESVAGTNTWNATPIVLKGNASLGADGASSLIVRQSITDRYQTQVIQFNGFVAGNAYLLTFGGTPTGTLIYSATPSTNAANIQAALQALAPVSLVGGTINVVQTVSSTFEVQFLGTMAGLSWPSITPTRLSGSGSFTPTSPAFAPHSPPLGITKYGTGTVQYTDTVAAPFANTYGGLTDVHQGTLQLDKLSGQLAITNDLQVGDNTPVNQVQTFTLTGFVTGDQFTLNYNGNDTAPITYYANATYEAVAIENAFNLPSILGVGNTASVKAINATTFAVTFGGGLSGTNPAFLITGAPVSPAVGTVGSGVINPAGAPFAANSAIARLLNNNQLATTSVVTVNSDGLFDLNNRSQQIAQLTVNTGTATTSFAASGTGALTVTGVNGVTVNGGTLTAEGSSSTITVNGPTVLNAVGAVPATLSAVGSSTVITLNGSLTETDSSVIASGNSSQVNVNGLFTMTGGSVTLTPATSRLNLGGDVSATSDSNTGTALISGGGRISLGGVDRVFTVDNGPSAVDLKVGTPIDGITSEGLSKEGLGRLEFDAVSTYTGFTVVHAGDLQVDGTIGKVAMTGGTLSGNGHVGTVAGAVGAATGIVYPGDNAAANPVGTLFTQPVTFGPGTTFFVDLKHTSVGVPVEGVDNDLLSVGGTGTVVELGGATLNGTVDPSVILNDTFTIIRATGGGTINGKFAEPYNPNTVFLSGIKFHVDYFSDHVDLTRVRSTVTVAVSSSQNPSLYGQAVLFTATLTPESGAGAVPTSDTVTFTFDGGLTQSVNVDGTGHATFDVQSAANLNGPMSVTAPGSPHTVHAHFNGDANTFDPGDGDLTPGQTVNKQPVNFSVSSTPPVNASTPVYGQAVDLTALVTPTVSPLVANSLKPSGNVTFRLDSSATQFVSVPLNVGTGTATTNFPNNLPSPTLIDAGIHTVNVSYPGNTNYAAPNPIDFNLTIKKDTTSTSITPQPQSVPSTPMGQTAYFDVKVTPGLMGSAGIPHGSLTFYDNVISPAAILSSMPYNGGTVTFSTNVLTRGTHTIYAVYSNSDGNYIDSTGSVVYTIDQAPTQTNFINASPASPAFGQAVTFTVSVVPNPAISPTFGPVTGQVTFWDGMVGGTGINLGTGSVSSGQASITTLNTALKRGSHTLYAVYSGDNSFATSTGILSPFVVSAATTSTSVSALPSTGIVFGQSVTLTAQVTATGPGSPGNVTLNSPVTFVDTTVPGSPITLGTGFTDASGRASISTTALPFGSRTITATFTDANGNATGNFATSNGSLVGFPVSSAATTTSLVASPAGGAIYGQTVTFTATVTRNAPSQAANPTVGTVTFMDGANVLGVRTLSGSNVAIYSTTTGQLNFGSHNISAVYNDNVDSNYGPSTGTIVGYSISKATTTTTLTANPASGDFYSRSVMLQAVVTSPTATPPNGAGSNVVFTDTTTGTVLGNANLVAGVATINTTALSVTTHTITATYTDSADANFFGSIGTLSNYQVDPANTLISSFTASPSGAGINQQITLSATALVQSPGTALVFPGSITFLDVTNPGSPITLGTVNVDNSGSASIITSFATPGSHNLTAQYLTNSVNFNSSPVASMTLVVRKASAVNVSPVSNVFFGQTVTFAVSVSGTPGTPTGTISVVDQTTSTNYGAFNLSGGSVSITIGAMNAGPHNMMFSYSGDTVPAPGFSPSSRTITQVINQAPTTTTISPSSGTSFYGQQVSIAATITGSTGVNPTTGAVAFYDLTLNTLLGAVNLAGNNTAILTTTVTQFSAGDHNIAAQYTSSANFAASPLSSARGQHVNKAATVTTLGTTTPSTYGTGATFTAAVTSNSPGTPGVPTSGAVGFVADSSIVLGYAQVNGSGVATLTTAGTALSAGSHSIQAIYVGNANFDVSGYSNVRTQTVNAATTAMVLASSAPNGAAYGNAITFAATVGIPGNTSTLPTGTVTFRDGATVLATLALNSSGVAVFTSTQTQFNPGSHAITATYNPDTGNFLSTNKSLNQTVNLASTSTTLQASPAYWAVSEPGSPQPINFTATVNVTSGGSPGVPAGFMQFNVDGALTTVVVDANGKAQLNGVTFTTMGSHTVTATYFPKTNPAQFFAGSSVTQTQNVRKPTAITLGSTPGNGGANLTATVTTPSTGGPPTGTVSFYEYAVINGVGTYTLLGNGTLSGGSTTFFASLNDQNTHTIVAVYNGDANFNPAATARNIQNGRLV